jgi:hypothetical protein
MLEFDCYVIVDWSASNKPNTGADSIWYCQALRSGDCVEVSSPRNPPTRCEAIEEIRGLLRQCKARGYMTLVGFDFPYGYPAGFAFALGLKKKPAWRAVWNELLSQIKDAPDNSNNRFEVAASLSRRISAEDFPFWGCPPRKACKNLAARRSRKHGQHDLREFRLTERRIRGPQSAWKLYGAGAVGSQALIGISYVAKLRDDNDLACVSRVWPFEVGLDRLVAREKRDWLILHAEIYPSIVRADPKPNEVRDSAQVRTLASCFARADEMGTLSRLFWGPLCASAEELSTVQAEEGWILGVQ